MFAIAIYLDFTSRRFLHLSQFTRNLQWRINKISDFRENIFIGHRQHNYIVLAALYSLFFQGLIQIDLYTIFPLNGNRVALESDVYTKGGIRYTVCRRFS